MRPNVSAHRPHVTAPQKMSLPTSSEEIWLAADATSDFPNSLRTRRVTVSGEAREKL